MWSVIVAFIQDLWPLLPEITIGLELATALIGFAVALQVLAQRIRRWLRDGDLLRVIVRPRRRR